MNGSYYEHCSTIHDGSYFEPIASCYMHNIFKEIFVWNIVPNIVPNIAIRGVDDQSQLRKIKAHMNI
jgi:hypothetical protein